MAENALAHLKKIHEERPEIQAAYDALGPRFKALRALILAREELQVSQAELARRMGVKQPVIARLESGENSPKIDTLAKAAIALGCELQVTFKPLETAGEPSPPAQRSQRRDR